MLELASDRLFMPSAVMATLPVSTPTAILPPAKQQVAHHADDAGQVAVGRADGAVSGLFMVFDEGFYQKIVSDGNAPFLENGRPGKGLPFVWIVYDRCAI